MPNKLSQFWQELKRRNVVRVITVYAGAAFMILELVDMVREPFELPNWSFKLVIIILSIGFIITVIVSWIYDIHPEGGIIKTEPAHKVKDEDIPKSSNSWKIASYISFVVIVGLIVLNIIPRSGKKEILDKSIVVLPFINLSSDQENTYFIDGIMESILDNLCKIEDLRVPGRTSVMQYRDNPKPIPVVAEEMNVAYVLEGSGQKIGNRLLLTVQLRIGHEDRHLWSNQYDRVIEKVEDLIDIQKEIAELVVREIEAIITPAEIALIEKVPTTSVTAHDFFLRARDDHLHFWINNEDRESLNRAEELYYRALEYDSTYAQAYTGLARVYWDKYYWRSFFTESFLDSVLILANIAISLDNQLSDAYTIIGKYFNEIGDIPRAIENFNNAIRFNPNDWMAYLGRGALYLSINIIQTIIDYQKAAEINRDAALPDILRSLGNVYYYTGFIEKGDYYYQEALRLDQDSVQYYTDMAVFAWFGGEFQKGVEYGEWAIAHDSDYLKAFETLGDNYHMLGQYDKSIEYYEKWLQKLNERGQLKVNMMHRVGYAFWRGGREEEAEYFFDEQIEYDTRMNELGRSEAQSKYTYYDLAVVYAFRGEISKALEQLRIFNTRKVESFFMVNLIKFDPLLDNLRDESEFQQIVRDLEAKYQAEHERVRQWLEENDML